MEQESLENCRKLIEQYHRSNYGRITCGLCPLGLDRVSADTLRVMGELSEKQGLLMHLHLACGNREVRQMQMRYGKRSIPFLDEMGLINERLMAIHLSVATEEELQLLAKRALQWFSVPEARRLWMGTSRLRQNLVTTAVV